MLDGTISLDDRAMFIDKARELGGCWATADLRQFTLDWEAEDLWKLRDLIGEAAGGLDEFFPMQRDLSAILRDAVESGDARWREANLGVLHYWED
jgi:hypothetical protein